MNADQFDNLQDYSGGNTGNPHVTVYPEGQRYNAQNNCTVVVDKPNYPWCTLVTSFISFFFCTCCGLCAIVLSLLSYTDHYANRIENSRSKRRIACGLAATSIVLCIVVIIIIGYFISQNIHWILLYS